MALLLLVRVLFGSFSVNETVPEKAKFPWAEQYYIPAEPERRKEIRHVS
jgi:hypothetical protein